MSKFIVEAKDEFGWYDHSEHGTEAEAIAEVNNFFDRKAVIAGSVRIVDTEAMSYVALGTIVKGA